MKNMLAECSTCRPARSGSIVPGIGGGFGGKLRVGVEHFAALARAQVAAGRSSCMTTSEEELTDAYPRQPTRDHAQDRRDARRPAAGTRRAASSSTAAPSPIRVRRRRRSRCRSWQGRIARRISPSRASPSTPTRADRLVPRAVRADGQLRRRVADGPHRRRRSASIRWSCACATSIREGDEGPAGQIADQRQHRGVPAARRRRHRVERAQARRRAAARASPAAGGLTTGGSSGVYVKINPDGTVTLNQRRGRARHAGRSPARRRSSPRSSGVDLTDINVVSADTLLDALRLSARRAAARPSRSAMPAAPPRTTAAADRSRWRRCSSACPATRSRCETSSVVGGRRAHVAGRGRAAVAAARAAG